MLAVTPEMQQSVSAAHNHWLPNFKRPLDSGHIPDLPVGRRYGVTDVKDVKEIYDSGQFRAFSTHAKEENRPFSLIISPKTESISETVIRYIKGNSRQTRGTLWE